MTSLTPVSSTTLGGVSITLTGTAFNGWGSAVRIDVGSDPCTQVKQISSTQLSCMYEARATAAAILRTFGSDGIRVWDGALMFVFPSLVCLLANSTKMRESLFGLMATLRTLLLLRPSTMV